jgi:hypothetical protein
MLEGITEVEHEDDGDDGDQCLDQPGLGMLSHQAEQHESLLPHNRKQDLPSLIKGDLNMDI